MPSAQFTFESTPTGRQVCFDARPVPWPVERVAVDADDDGPSRHRFTVVGADRGYIQVSYDPDRRGDADQLVWIETSMDPTLFLLDRPGQWARHAGGRVSPSEYPTRFVPTAVPAAVAYATIVAAVTG